MMRRFSPTQPLGTGVTLLEASAGTGKTYGITSLVLRLMVEEGLRIDEILVVTFTEPATAELRDRVRLRLRQGVAALETAGRDAGARLPEDEVLAHLVRRANERGSHAQDARALRAGLEAFDQAAISTIHGWCARVLREHAFECGAELDAELLTDATALLDEIVHDFWAREVATRPARAVAELVALGLSVEALAALAKLVTADPDARVVPEPHDGDAWEAADEAHAVAREELARAWRTHGRAVRALVEQELETGVLSGTSFQKRHLPAWFEELDGWAHEPTREVPDDRFRKFGASSVANGVRKGKQAPSHPFFADCDALLEEIALAGARRRLAFEAELLRVRHACVAYARAELARRKRARRLQTYDDLLHLVRDALRHPRQGPLLGAALRARFRAALIDEFQDTDAVQWEIFRRAFGGDDQRLVLIGDPKQAIYSFRGADIHAYLDARRLATARFGLGTNRRSDGPLVAAVNHLFARAARPFAVDGVEFEPVEAHHRTSRLRGTEGAPFQLRLVPREGGDAIGKETMRDTVAALVADDVVRTLASSTRILDREGKAHDVAPRDLAVLVRTNRQALQVQRALRRAGVPGVVYGAVSVFESAEAVELEAVLAALLEPANMRLVRAALATDLLGLAAAAELEEADAAAPGTLGAGDALARLDADDARWEPWLDRLRAWAACWAARGVMPAIRAMMEELRLPERLLALEDGERRLTDLRHVAELLHVTAVQERLEPPALLAWLRARCEDPDGDAEAHQMRLESDADAVQIVTVHRSKGLEYPIVWCPYLWESPLRDRPPAAFRFHDGAGRCIDLGPHAEREAHHLRLQDDEYAEALRLMYVALTRARHRCVVHWGAASGCGASPLARLLHGRDGATVTERRAATVEHVEGLDDAGMRAEIEAIAAASGGEVEASVSATWQGLRWRAPWPSAAELEARRWRRASPLDGAWRVGSFTGLTRGAHAGYAERADDEAPEALADARAGAEEGGVHAESVPLDQFPSSARAGILFHDVLERHDVGAPEALPALVRERLTAYGFDAGRWGDPVTAALRSALDTSLLEGAGAPRLVDVGAGDRLTELRFELPVHGGLAAAGGATTAAQLAAAFRAHPGGSTPASYADRVAALRFRELRGFLTGAMDLVARHGGRWWLVDYKSNHLGPYAADYAPAALQGEMAEAHYHLQYHLYLLALHRYLAWRQPGYDYERDVGGVLYLFFRGMDHERGASKGVFHDRPPLARLRALEAALGMTEVRA